MFTCQSCVSFTVPLTPPSVNHYKKPVTFRTSAGPRKSFTLTDEARAFLQAVQLFARGATLIPETPAERKAVRYALFVKVYQGRLPLRARETKQRDEWGDGDNYWKCIADGLTKAGVIHDDRRVRLWHLEVIDDDRDNPRTEIQAQIWPNCGRLCDPRDPLPVPSDEERDFWYTPLQGAIGKEDKK